MYAAISPKPEIESTIGPRSSDGTSSAGELITSAAAAASAEKGDARAARDGSVETHAVQQRWRAPNAMRRSECRTRSSRVSRADATKLVHSTKAYRVRTSGMSAAIERIAASCCAFFAAASAAAWLAHARKHLASAWWR